MAKSVTIYDGRFAFSSLTCASEKNEPAELIYVGQRVRGIVSPRPSTSTNSEYRPRRPSSALRKYRRVYTTRETVAYYAQVRSNFSGNFRWRSSRTQLTKTNRKQITRLTFLPPLLYSPLPFFPSQFSERRYPGAKHADVIVTFFSSLSTSFGLLLPLYYRHSP